MGKNGGEPTDTILTLEEALSRFKRKRSGVGEEAGVNPQRVPAFTTLRFRRRSSLRAK